MTGAEVVRAARCYLGAPWKHQGRSVEGIDCAGLVIKVAHELKLFSFDTADYSRQAKDETMLALCREHLVQVPIAEARPGDVPVMRFGTNRHIGIFGDYTFGGLSIVHAYSNHPRRVVEHRFSEDWLRLVKAELIGVFRFPGVDA